MSEYPYEPLIEYFRDPTLYFAQLPRDILEHCLLPLIGEQLNLMTLPQRRDFQLETTVAFPEEFRSLRHVELVMFLPNGDVILFLEDWDQLCRFSLITSQILWRTDSIVGENLIFHPSLSYLAWSTKGTSPVYQLMSLASLSLSQPKIQSISPTEYQHLRDLFSQHQESSTYWSLVINAHQTIIPHSPEPCHIYRSRTQYYAGYIVQTVSGSHHYINLYRCF